MSVAKIIEISASSSKSFSDAVENGIKQANDSLDNISGAWVKEQKVDCSGGEISKYRVTLKVTFILKD